MKFLTKLVPLICRLVRPALFLSTLLQSNEQLVIVTTPDWTAHQGVLHRYEKQESDPDWTIVGHPIPIVVGEKGMAWGIGLHSQQECTPSLMKQEGDGKAPAGLFLLGPAFGWQTPPPGIKISYLLLTPSFEAVDDLNSLYYNQVIDRNQVVPDWDSAEAMYTQPLYARGLVVQHNFPYPQRGAGSAIFIHKAPKEGRGTLGCTGMSPEDLEELLLWLDPEQHPRLAQLPIAVYQQMQAAWKLPLLP